MDLKKKKIAQVLGLFTNKEWDRLYKFIKSPYFVKENLSEQYLELLKIFQATLEPSAEDNSHLPSNEAEIFKCVFPDQTFSTGKVKKRITQLTQLVFQFLGQEGRNLSVYLDLTTLQNLRLKGAENLWLSQINKTRKNLTALKGNNFQSLFSLQLNYEKYLFSVLDPLKNATHIFTQYLDSLDDFYSKQAIDTGILLLAQNRFIIPPQLEDRFQALNAILADKSKMEQGIEQKIKLNIFSLLSHPENIALTELSKLMRQLEKNQSKFSSSSYSNLRTILRNFIIRFYNRGDRKMEAFIFELYKKDFQNRTLFVNDKIPASTVNNIGTFAIRQKAYSWLDSFLSSQESQIMEAHLQKFTIGLNRAKLLFFQGNFSKALNHLIFETTVFHLKIAARILEVMIHFEMSSQQLSHKIEAYKIFIYRLPKEKLTEHFIEGHRNFIDLLKMINHPKTVFNSSRKEKIQQKIMATNLLAEREWLLEKIEGASDGT